MRMCVIGFAFGVWLLQQQAQLPGPAAYWFVLPLLLVGLAGRRFCDGWREAARRTMLLACCVTCGFVWSAWRADLRLADQLPAAWEGVDIRIIGVVATMPQAYERSTRFEFDVGRVLTPDAVLPSHIVLSWWGAPAGVDGGGLSPGLHAGERWQLTVRLRRPHGTLNPAGFDYEAWLLERNIRATGYVRAGDGNRRLAAFVMTPAYAVERAREFVRARIQSALADSPYAGVLIALAVGDQRAIPAEQWQIFTRTGVNHLISISGLHVTMLAGLAFALVYHGWRRCARLTLRLPARKAAAVGGLLAAFAYSWLAGFAVPAQRTVYMLAVVALALWAGRTTAASYVLCAALCIVLTIDPWAVSAPGFWLSFGAVAIILFVSGGRIAQAHWLTAWARVQWAITLGLIPLLLALFQQISLVSPLANAFAIPLVSVVVVPLTLLGVIVPWDFLLAAAHGVMAACTAMLEWIGALPFAVWQQHAPAPWTVPVAVAGVFWLLMPKGFPARATGAVALVPLFTVLPPVPAEGSLRLTVLDVGQGLAVVAQTSNHALVYDAGPSYGLQADSGTRTVVPFLRASGIKALSGMIVTHADNDHSGGANAVMQAMQPPWLATSIAPGHFSIANAPGVERCETGGRWNWDGVEFEFLHPPAASYAREKVRGNDRSCVLKISAGGTSVLLAADVEQKSEREMLASVRDLLRARVLLVPHHGSRTSSSTQFIDSVNPDYALVAAGYRNRFGHPKDDVLDRYRRIGARVYRTELDGALLLELSGQGVAIQRYRALYRRYWHSPLENPDLADEMDEQLSVMQF